MVRLTKSERENTETYGKPAYEPMDRSIALLYASFLLARTTHGNTDVSQH